VHTIRQGLRTLASHPEIGRPPDETPAEFREWFIPFGQSGCVTLYHDDSATVTILAVRHGREAGY
jgi:plasmid stabilization system protein ParE